MGHPMWQQSDMGEIQWPEVPLVPAPVAVVCALFAFFFGVMMGSMMARRRAMMAAQWGGGRGHGGMHRGMHAGMGHHHHGDGTPPCGCGEWQVDWADKKPLEDVPE